MKQILLIAAFVCAQFTVAQISLEHTYDKNTVTRVKFEHNGEKYYLYDKTTGHLMFYNADHTFWKSVDLRIPEINMFTTVLIGNVSETVFNDDANIEVAYTYNQSPPVNGDFYTGKVIAEDGTVLLDVPGCVYLNFNQEPGLSDKIFAQMENGQMKIYEVQGLTLEHTYLTSVTRKKLENSGEKYYTVNQSSEVLNIFSSDHSLWKSVPLSKPTAAGNINITLLSENKIDSDAALEIGYFYNVNEVSEARLVKESGNVLLTIPEGYGVFVDEFSDNKKLNVRTKTSNSYSYLGSRIYSLPSLELEKIYDEAVTPVALENSGGKYYTPFTASRSLKIYNPDHTLWKTIPLNMPEGYDNFSISHLSEAKINNDPLLEIFYTSQVSALLEPYFLSYVANENGILLAEIYSAQNIKLDETPGLDKKIIGYMVIEDYQQVQGTVYSLGVLGTTAFEKNSAVLYPNPVVNELHFQNLQSPIVQVKFYNLVGSLVKSQKGNEITAIDIQDLHPGTYLVNLTDSNGKTATHKIVVSR